MKKFFFGSVGIFLVLLCSGCATSGSSSGCVEHVNANGTDELPAGTRALIAFLVDESDCRTMDVGRVPYAGVMMHRELATGTCKAMAKDAAKWKKIHDWDYYCCTETEANSCASKVK